MNSPLPLEPLPLVSVLIRSMDRPSLDHALASVAAQTWGNIEVVVVNAKGAGHRVLPSLCGQFPLRFIDSTAPRPRSEAANVALESAAGAFLLFLDDDDQILPSHILNLATELQNNQVVIAAYTGTILHTNGEEVRRNEEWDVFRLRTMNYLPIHSVLFRQTARRMDCALDVMEDWDFWLQLSIEAEFSRIPGYSAIYNMNQGTSGLSSQRNMDLVFESHSKILEKWLPFFGMKFITKSIFNYETSIDFYKKETTLLSAKIKTTQQSLETTQQLVWLMQNSRSWKITKPLRKIGSFAKKVFS